MNIFDTPQKTIIELEHQLEKLSLNNNPARHSWSISPSMLGHECAAFLWNKFRWIAKPSYPGRIARIFETGNLAEPYLETLLEQMGWQFERTADGKQHSFEDLQGFMRGKLDGIAAHPTYTNGQKILLEYKTYNTKRFVALKNKKNVAETDYEYFIQTQVYMKYYDLPACLFVALNKNDSDVYFEIIVFNENTANAYIKRAEDVLNSQTQLRKLSQNPTHHVCKWCDFHAHCHEDARPDHNCRSCKNAYPRENKRWYCTKWEMLIPKNAVEDGCDFHDSILH